LEPGDCPFCVLGDKSMTDYGPLAFLVTIAGNLAAAAFALRVLWAGKTGWEPKIRDFPNAPTRVTALACMIGIAVAFSLTRAIHGLQPILPWAIGFSLVAIVAFLVDIIARTTLIVRCGDDDQGTLAGLWLTRRAKDIM